MKLRTTVQISSAIAPKKPALKREDSFMKRFTTRQIPETQVSFVRMKQQQIAVSNVNYLIHLFFQFSAGNC